MNDKKERVYSEEDLCEYTILQKIEELERQLQNIKNVASSLYETKEDASTAHTIISDNIASVENKVPTDVGIKDNKLGLKIGNTWLTNLNAINLEGFTYIENTNTLKVEGGTSVTFPYDVNESYNRLFNATKYDSKVAIVTKTNGCTLIYANKNIPKDITSNDTLYGEVLYLITGYRKTAFGLGTNGAHNCDVLLTTERENASGTYFLPYINNEKVKLLCNKDVNIHNISLSYNAQSYLYFTLITSSNTAISSMIELNALLDTPNRHISCSGTIYINQKFFPISCLFWQGALSKSYILYTDPVNGERSIIMTNAFGTENTIVTDIVKPI